MSGWAFYNAVRDAMRRMAEAERDDKAQLGGNYLVGEHGPEITADPPDTKR